MMGEHIRKRGERWEYPDMINLQKKCGLFSIEEYVERWRGALWEYLEANGEILMEKALETEINCQDVNKVLWWNQRFNDKDSGRSDYFDSPNGCLLVK